MLQSGVDAEQIAGSLNIRLAVAQSRRSALDRYLSRWLHPKTSWAVSRHP